MIHLQNDYSNSPSGASHLFQEYDHDIPASHVSYHHCIRTSETPLFKFLLKLGIVAGPEGVRARTKLHEGSMTEWQYKLMTYGIPQQSIPLTSEGNVKTRSCTDHFDMKRRIEELLKLEKHAPHSGTRNYVLVPRRADVLMGKGSNINQSPGNKALQILVEDRLMSYRFGSRSGKSDIITEVLEKVLSLIHI